MLPTLHSNSIYSTLPASFLSLSDLLGSQLDLHPLALGLVIGIRSRLTFLGTVTGDMASTAALGWNPDGIGASRIGTGLGSVVASIALVFLLII